MGKISGKLEEIFVIPDDNNRFLIYGPKQGAFIRANSEVVNTLKRINSGEDSDRINPEIVEMLARNHLLEEHRPTKTPEDFSYNPTSVTLLPTYGCNLRCVYCYARAGEDIGQNMTPELAHRSIDLILDNAEEKGAKYVHLGFHGGGEPFTAFPLVQEAVRYFNEHTKNKKFKKNIGAVTNGVIGPDRLKWIVNNFSNLAISIDGTEAIQNRQRPKADGKGSFEDVTKTIKYLEDQHFNYSIRATVTQESVKHMSEIVEFFSSISSNKVFQLEPLFECGRCNTTKESAPDPREYVENLLKARTIGRQLGKEVSYSGASLNRLGEHFCGSTQDNFFVAPNGIATTCLESCREGDELSEIFQIGRYDSEKHKFVFYPERIKRLRESKVSSMDSCKDCFAKWNCSGDCRAKNCAQCGSINDTTKNKRCFPNTALLLSDLLSRFGETPDIDYLERRLK